MGLFSKKAVLEFSGEKYDYVTMHDAYLAARKAKQSFMRYAGSTIDIDPSKISKISVNGKTFDVN